MINLSTLLEGDNDYQIDSNLDLEDILREDEESPNPGYSLESPCVDTIQTDPLDIQEFLSPLVIQHLPHNASTYAVSHQYLGTFHNNTLNISQNNRLLQSLKMSNTITCLIFKKQLLLAGFENGFIHIYEIHSLNLQQKIQEHTAAIIALAFIKQSQSILQIVSSDVDGNVKLISIEPSIFRNKITSQILINKAECPVTQLLTNSVNQYIYLTMGNQSLVLTMLIVDTIKVIHVFEKQKSTIDLHWGKCNHQSQLINALSIQWNSFIQLVTFVDATPWYLYYYSADIPLLSAKFISETLMIASSQGGFQVLYIPYFSQGKFTFKNDNKALIGNQIFHRTISCVRVVKNVIYFLSDTQLFQLHALSWLQYFKTLIQQDQWNQALRFLIQVYRDNIKGMPYLELEEDKLAIKKLAPTLLTSILTKNNISTQILNSCIQFILYCEIPQHLSLIKEAAIIHNQSQFYYQMMEANLSHIYELPKDVFFDLANNFSPESFQKLVINLNLSSIDIGYTYELCLNKQIYTPLLYICPRKEEDFITPLNKMFEMQKTVLYDKCLWFIEITQKQILFPNDSIPIEIWRKAIRQQMLWLMEVLQYFLSEKLFHILYKYLTHPCLGALLHEDVYSYFQISSERELTTCVFENVSKIIENQCLLPYLLFTSKLIQSINVKTPDQLLLRIFQFNKQYIETYNSMPEDLDQVLQIIHHLMPHYSLQQQALECQCVDYVAYCLQSQGKIHEAINQFFQYEQLKLRVYKWLQFQDYDPVMLQSLDILLELDAEKCAIVLQSWPIEVLEKLIILQPTKLLLNVFKQLNIVFSQFMQLKLIELMSIHEPEEVIAYMQNKAYPLDEVLRIFERTENIEGIGYINEQRGNYAESIDCYLEIYKQESYAYLTSFRNQERVVDTFQNLMRTCKTACESDDSWKNLYFKIGTELFNKKMHVSHWCKLKKSYVFNLQFGKLFMCLFKNSAQQLISIIESNTETFNQVHLKNSFISVFKEFSYERQLVNKISTIIRQDNIKLFKSLFNQLSISNQFQNICLECGEPVNEDYAVLLKCGHCVHAFCLQHKYCTICQNISTQSLLECINIEEIKKSILTEQMDTQQLQLLQNLDDFQIESYDDQQLVIDPKEREEMRIMNKLMIFDNFVEENETKNNAFIEQYY